MTVCLSDSQLHLFLQTQLPVGHILDCVQGHTPYTVTDAILTYASSNQGLAQAQEDEPTKESGLAVSYESMERYRRRELIIVGLSCCSSETEVASILSSPARSLTNPPYQLKRLSGPISCRGGTLTT